MWRRGEASPRKVDIQAISHISSVPAQLVVLLVAGVHAARLGPGHGAAGGGGGAAGQGAALLHD